MIRIPYEDGPRFNYREFDMMMSIATGRDNLIAGKTINTGIRNEITIFFEGIAMILLAVLLRILIPGADKLLGYVFIGFGVLLILVNLLLGALSVYSYRKTLQIGPIKSDIIFDESGLHSWESEERGFDADWENITHCFLFQRNGYTSSSPTDVSLWTCRIQEKPKRKSWPGCSRGIDCPR